MIADQVAFWTERDFNLSFQYGDGSSNANPAKEAGDPGQCAEGRTQFLSIEEYFIKSVLSRAQVQNSLAAYLDGYVRGILGFCHNRPGIQHLIIFRMGIIVFPMRLENCIDRNNSHR